ncbi:hypothetical protein, partial [Anaerotruncus massiliensis (ex Liu et al. 2021)]|uniref:hypothetical protein n=1 Tax=Anaerotruncus massiliensis (ex Liu et al. 2021) TaxID=2321404 RepID=UPI003A8B0C51
RLFLEVKKARCARRYHDLSGALVFRLSGALPAGPHAGFFQGGGLPRLSGAHQRIHLRSDGTNQRNQEW